jgi:hypothetical protein
MPWCRDKFSFSFSSGHKGLCESGVTKAVLLCTKKIRWMLGSCLTPCVVLGNFLPKIIQNRWYPLMFSSFFFIPGFPASRFKTTAGRTVVFWNWFRVWTLAENVSSSAWPYLMCSVNIPNLPLARLFCKRRCQACKINIPWCCSAGFVVPILSWRYGSLQKSARILFVGIPCLFFFKLGL